MRKSWVLTLVALVLVVAAAVVWQKRSPTAEEPRDLTVDVPAYVPGASPTPVGPHRNLDLRLDITGVAPQNFYWAQIDDALGVKVWHATVNPNESRATARTLGLSPGLYNIQLTDDGGVLLRHYVIRVVHK